MSGIPGEGFDSQQILLITVTSVCLALSTMAMILRLLIRWFSAAMLWWDDWVAFLALVTSWLVNVCTLIGIKYGLGTHGAQVDPSNINPFGVSVFVQQIAWALSTGLIILAILLFYTRIFPNMWMRKAIYIIGAWDTAWTISAVLVTIFQCNPIDFLWDRKIQDGQCINSNAFYFACSLTSTVTVVTALLLPLPIVWTLQISTSRKIGLAISFTMGAFVCIASIVRLVVLLDIDPEDLMYTSTFPQLWSCVELSFGIISACLPSLTPLFLIILGKRPASSKRSRAEFIRIAVVAEATDGDARSQSLELVIPNRKARNDPNNLDGSAAQILVTHQIDQVRDKKTDQIPEAEQMGVVLDASTWNV